jgi:hypothetical protein
MGFASLVLFAFAGYLTYRAVTQKSASTNSILQSCDVIGAAVLVDFFRDPVEGYVSIYESEVDVAGGPGVGTCDIALRCTSSHVSGGFTFCDVNEPFPVEVACWNTVDDATPVCVEPGAEWKSSLVGAVVTWVFAIAFVVIAFMLQKSIRASSSLETVTVVQFAGQPANAAPVLMGTPVVVTGIPYPVDQQSGGGHPISAGGQYPVIDPPIIANNPVIRTN